MSMINLRRKEKDSDKNKIKEEMISALYDELMSIPIGLRLISKFGIRLIERT